MATQIVELTGDEAALLRSLDKVIQKQLEYERKLRDSENAGKDAGDAIGGAFDKAQRDADKALKGLLGDLKQLGPEGSAAAEALKGHLTEAGKAGFQSMDKVLEQIRALDPEAAAAAEAAASKIKDELGRAAQYSEGEFAQVLDELRAMGPEGKQAADEIRKELVAAGKIAEKSMADVVAQLERISPEAAAAGKAIVTNIEKGDSMFKSFGKSAIAEVSAIAGAYIGVQEAIQLVNDYLELQADLLREAKDAQLELAKAQQDAAKNLAALTADERKDLLAKAPTIAQDAGFGDVNQITAALGTVASTGLNDPAKIADIVKQAARIERLTPEQLPATAAGAADVQAKTGLEDIRQALALISDTGAESLVGNPDKLAANLPKALAAGAATAPEQSPAEAARQAAAIFAAATTVGTDTQGDSSATFTITLLSRMDKFFADLSDEQVKARSQIELIDRKIAQGSDTERDRLEKGRLSDFLTASEGIRDPQTLFGRLQILQKSETLARQFQGESGFGEAQFKPFLEGILDGNSEIAKNVNASFGRIGASADKFETIAKELESGTPQLTTATFVARQQGLISGQQAGNNEGAALEAIRSQGAEVLKQTLPGGVEGFFNNWLDTTAKGGLTGSTAAEEAVDLVNTLLVRARIIASDGMQAGDAQKIGTIRDTIANVQEYIRSQGEAGALDPAGVARAREMAAANADYFSRGEARNPAWQAQFANMEALLARIAATNEATANNTTPKAPSVTPALGGQQP